ncbi:MAG: ABC transporter ATP-binding protein [Asgard group archaeon]|nr:ABC transporter ATP-binding protein [Asgard group archaeon]
MTGIISQNEISETKRHDEAIIEVSNLYKIYNKDTPAEVVALDNVTIGFQAKKMVAIIGPSGSGKSSLLNILGCMDSATSGSVFLNGDEITRLPENRLANIRKNKIGFIFQQFLLVPTLTALENVLLPVIPDGIKQSDRERAIMLLDKVGLGDRIDHKPSELSGGEKQRCSVARALINNPTILFADEPTGNLDSKTGESLMKLLHQLNKDLGLTVIVVTHDPLIMKEVDQKVEIKDGKIIT